MTDAFGHKSSEYDGGEADHDEDCAFDDFDLLFIILSVFDGEYERKGY